MSFPSITELLEVGKGKDAGLLDGMGPVVYYMQTAESNKTRDS